jgi:D-glycero-alpha-D-manno-heptose-7-phosphate kinase
MAEAMLPHLPDLVMTRTPLRVSFAGGGTDLHEFYAREPGAVFSTTINKYVYVTVKRHSGLYKEAYRLNYAETEHAANLDEIKNDIARECLRLVHVDPPLYISTVADIPAASGLGGSSSFAVGLLRALHAMRGERVNAAQLVEEAVHVEVDMLNRPIGKQDHAAAGYGGLNFFRFRADGGISIEPHSPPPEKLETLFSHIQMFWTGITRDSRVVLAEQKANTGSKMEFLRAMRDQADELSRLVRGEFDIETFGRVLDAGWRLKRDLASTISSNQIDTWYENARQVGAYGGKLCGAGGGGFLLFVAPTERHGAIHEALSDLTEISVGYEPRGAQLMFSGLE